MGRCVGIRVPDNPGQKPGVSTALEISFINSESILFAGYFITILKLSTLVLKESITLSGVENATLISVILDTSAMVPPDAFLNSDSSITAVFQPFVM